MADVPGVSCEQFANDTNLTSIYSRSDLREHERNLHVKTRQSRSVACGVSVNKKKLHRMETSQRALPTTLSLELAQDALIMTKLQSHRHLGVIFSHDLRWNSRVNNIPTKATRLLSVLR